MTRWAESGFPISPKRAARRERELTLQADAPALLATICEAVSDGLGLAGWCASKDVRYGAMRAWLLADVERFRSFEAATAMRANMGAETVEAIGRKLLAPEVRTGIDWVDDGPAELDPRAARVAIEAFKFAATTGDRDRFGKTVQHNHTHRMQADHLEALRKRSGAGGPAHAIQSGRGPGMPAREGEQAIDVAFRALPSPTTSQRIESIGDALLAPFRLCERSSNVDGSTWPGGGLAAISTPLAPTGGRVELAPPSATNSLPVSGNSGFDFAATRKAILENDRKRAEAGSPFSRDTAERTRWS